MARLIKFKKSRWKKGKGKFRLYIVQFEDTEGNIYGWAPKWEEIEDIFKRMYATEESNNGGDWYGMTHVALQVLIWLTNNLLQQNVRLRKAP